MIRDAPGVVIMKHTVNRKNLNIKKKRLERLIKMSSDEDSKNKAIRMLKKVDDDLLWEWLQR